jgi:ABC-type lipoprotein export system ATPase subunit
LALALAGVGRRARRSMAIDALERLDLGDRAHAAPSQLSGGEQQRVALARAVAAGPDVVLADEPTGALDVTSAGRVLDAFRQLSTAGHTIVMVTHDRDVAAAADRVVDVVDGAVAGTGASEPVLVGG